MQSVIVASVVALLIGCTIAATEYGSQFTEDGAVCQVDNHSGNWTLKVNCTYPIAHREFQDIFYAEDERHEFICCGTPSQSFVTMRTTLAIGFVALLLILVGRVAYKKLIAN